VVGATIYSGTIRREYSTYPCYTLTYSTSAGPQTVYLPAGEITPALPNPIPNPVAVDYVGPIDDYHYTLDFRYQGVNYSASWCPSCPVKNPYIAGDANHCNPPLTDVFFAHVYIYSYDAAGTVVKTPAAGVEVHVYVHECGGDCGDGHLYKAGSTHTDANGKWSMSFPFAPQGHDGYATYYLAGYPPAEDVIDWAGLCVED
jgi:hypothetical protein